MISLRVWKNLAFASIPNLPAYCSSLSTLLFAVLPFRSSLTRGFEAQEERSRIARKLHDDVSQRLAVLSWGLQQLHKEVPPNAPACLSEQLEAPLSQASEISNEVRILSRRLRSSHLRNLEIDFTHGDLPKDIPQDVSLCLFQILQESLHNAVKYSGVQRFEARLQRVPSGFRLVIWDSGIGFDGPP